MMTATLNAIDLLAQHMNDPETGWSLGTFGAIAEFTRDADEPVTLANDGKSLTAATARGAIRLSGLDAVRLFASETTTRESWAHRVSLCLPADQCAMHQRTVLTPLGPDADAIRAQDSASHMFDLGLGALQVDLCVRVADADVAARLTALAGQPLFSPGNPAMSIILAANPHRVFLSRLGRIEVFQPIPPPDGRSPEGPHTHLLPQLLRAGRTHSANEPVPEGWVPCAHMYPAHPTKDAMGRSHAFDRRKAEAFDSILRAYGEPEIVSFKQRVLSAMDAAESPEAIRLPGSRFARGCIRVALRQRKAASGPSAALAAWAAAFERVDKADDETSAADPYGHH